MIRTHKHYLVENHGLNPEHNPSVYCACGRTTSADMCVDLVPLDMRVRKALGLDSIDFLCDGCQARLFCNRHIAQDEFYALLGEDADVMHEHNMRDAEWQQGVDLRHDAHKPRHERVSLHRVKHHKDHTTVKVTAPIPLHERAGVTHTRQAQWLAYKYNLTNIEQPPQRG